MCTTDKFAYTLGPWFVVLSRKNLHTNESKSNMMNIWWIWWIWRWLSVEIFYSKGSLVKGNVEPLGCNGWVCGACHVSKSTVSSWGIREFSMEKTISYSHYTLKWEGFLGHHHGSSRNTDTDAEVQTPRPTCDTWRGRVSLSRMVGVHKCYKRLVLNMAMPQNAHESLADLVLGS